MWELSSKSSQPLSPLCPPCWTGGSEGKSPRPRLKLRLAWLLFALTLLLPGCVSLTSKPIPAVETLPTRPALTSLTATSDGGITMDKRDAAELLIYIEALERAAGMVRQ